MELKYIKKLDGIRAIAIFLVIIWHYFSCQVNPALLSGNMKYLKQITSLTWSGVDLFFVLSGFLIGRILIFYKNSNDYFKVFYIRRFLRIFPAYYLILIIFILILLCGISTSVPNLTKNAFPLFSYIFYIQNFWMAHNGFGADWFGVTWSLAIEEQFYIILPLVIYLINIKYLPYFFVTSILLAPVFRYLFSDLAPYVLLPARMDSLLIGVLIAYYHLNNTINSIFIYKKKYLVFTVFILSFLIIVLKINGLGGAGEVLIHSVLTLFYGVIIALILSTEKNDFTKRLLSSKLMAFFAKISYMVYLIHLIIIQLLYQFILHKEPQINDIKDMCVTILSLILTVGIATISYYFYEKPIMNIGKKYVYNKEYKN